jgi:hypothetical protein
MTKHSELNNYTNYFKNWQVKLLGPKPTEAQVAAIHALGARPGKQALASAMALRDGGVTGAQVVMACGAPQLNKMRGFVADGVARWVPTPADTAGHKVYRLELTAKGAAKGKAATKAAAVAASKAAAPDDTTATAKPAKRAKAAKRAKPGKPVTEPVSEPVTAAVIEAAVSEPQATTDAPQA